MWCRMHAEGCLIRSYIAVIITDQLVAIEKGGPCNNIYPHMYNDTHGGHCYDTHACMNLLVSSAVC